MHIKHLVVAVMSGIALLAGCEVAPEITQTVSENPRPAASPAKTSEETAKYKVQIVSEPPGAVIEINDNYVGKAPIVIELEGWAETRTFIRSHTVVAHPLARGGYTQVKSFIGWPQPSKTYGDVIPEKIYFNMSLSPVKK